jgi:Ca-activated chloride channel family protein
MSMIRLAHPGYLYLLAGLPLLLVAFVVYRRLVERSRRKFGNLHLIDRLSPEASRRKPYWKFAIVLFSLGMLIIALADPQIGTKVEEVKLEGVDLFIALDVSNSMKAEDIKPNRLERAKLEIHNLIERLSGDRIGLIVFAGEAYTQFPLTTDYSAASLFLDAVDTDIVPVQGTAIGKAIDQAMKSFDFKESTTRVLVIITDGENNEGDAFKAAEEAAKKGVLIYAIGMGSTSGVPIPVYDGSGQRVDFKRDKDGKVVLTRLDRDSLEKMVSFGKGKYYRGTAAQDELKEIYDDINALEKQEFGTKRFTDYESRFQYFLGAAIVLLFIDCFISEKRARWITRWIPGK